MKYTLFSRLVVVLTLGIAILFNADVAVADGCRFSDISIDFDNDQVTFTYDATVLAETIGATVNNTVRLYAEGSVVQLTHQIIYERVDESDTHIYRFRVLDISGSKSIRTLTVPLNLVATGQYRVFISNTRGNNNKPPDEECGFWITLGGQYSLCSQIPSNAGIAKERCLCCEQGRSCDDAGFDYQGPGIWTAVGCIQYETGSMIQDLISIGLGVAGGAALLMIMAAGFMFTTSKGDPKRTGEAKDIMTSAIIGLLFIIFSVTILEFIGVTILRIPGFGE